MIYKVFIIDGDNCISILEVTFRDLSKIQDLVLTGFFNAINQTVDNIQAAMAKGRRINEMTRVLESEDSTIAIYFHPLSRMLFCTISDADDDTEKIKNALTKIGNRFWKKHEDDIKLFRTTTESSRFESFGVEIENITIGGRVAETFPKLLVVKGVLDKIKSMGMISDSEYQIALMCSGKNSPLKISRMLEIRKSEIRDALKKLEELDIINR